MCQFRLAFLAFSIGFACQSASLTPEQAIQSRNISALTFSPDDSQLACVVSEPPKDGPPASHIWILDIARNDFRQLTFSAKSESAPRWSPDGRALAFLSDRNERMQIYLLQMVGGEASALTSGKNAVSEFRWSPDGTEIAFLAPEAKSEADEKKEKDKDDAKVADREQDLARLWIVNAASKTVRQLTRGAWKIEDFDWISAGRILAVATDQPKSETWNTAIFDVSTADGKMTPFSRPGQPFGGLSISPDRTHIAYVATHNAGPAPHDLFLQDVAGGPPRDATAAIDRRVLGVKWQNDFTPVVSVDDGFRLRLYKLNLSGSPSPIDLAYSNGDFAVAKDGTVVFVGFAFNRRGELFIQPPNSSAKQVSHVQPSWAGITLADAELFRFKSFDGTQIEAALMKPPQKSDGKLPLILYVHGGPAGSFSAAYSPWPQLLAARGYEVLMVNPRGSSSNGEEFLKANRADWGGGDFKDLMAGIDAVLARGDTDPNRLGIGGWSYGGYMAEWAVTQTNRFKAAVSGAGMFDLAAEFGTEQVPAEDEWYFGTPWEHPDQFAHSSPYMYVRNAKTPTLILQGENDPIDPVGQSTALYRALKRYGVETELVIYPREPHGVREEKHQIDILRRMLDWFDRYVKPEK
ncbi:MAG: S9 family peptidase [Acidobacteriaceae bacterium]|nr:S9 family peptidase [Acidobacteriaceae bacterium]